MSSLSINGAVCLPWHSTLLKFNIWGWLGMVCTDTPASTTTLECHAATIRHAFTAYSLPVPRRLQENTRPGNFPSPFPAEMGTLSVTLSSTAVELSHSMEFLLSCLSFTLFPAVFPSSFTPVERLEILHPALHPTRSNHPSGQTSALRQVGAPVPLA